MTTWVKVFNSMPGHGKFLLAGDRAGWLFVCGICYSNEHLTNGLIPRHALPAVAPGVKSPEGLAVRLVNAGLWHEVDGGWRIHDYDEHQRSADEIKERRVRDAARKSADRASVRSPRGQTSDSARNPEGVQAEPRARDRAPSQEIEGRRQRAEIDKTSMALRADVIECFEYWRERCNHPNAKLTREREQKVRARFRENYTVLNVRQGIDGAATNPPRDRDSGVVHDDLVSICRNGAQLERYMDRAGAVSGGRVIPLDRPAALRQADAWRDAAEYRDGAS